MRWPSRASGRTLAVCAVLGLSGITAACGGASDSGTAGASAEGRGDVLTIEDFAYSPEPLVVDKATVVRVVNNDDAAHTVTADDGSFDTGELGKGESRDLTLDGTGELAYHCSIHDYMQGVIRVSG